MDAQVTRIGCKRDARKALAGELSPVMKRDRVFGDVPARGASRAAFRSPDGAIVYKVCHDTWMGAEVGDDNLIESDAVARARKSPTGEAFVLPTTTWMIDGVPVNAQPALVMEGRTWIADCHAKNGCNRYGPTGCEACVTQDEVYNAASELGISDMHDANWGVDAQGRAWIMDANC